MFANKIAIVTGGSRGIGKAISIKLASLGAKVYIFYAGNEQAAGEVVDFIQKQGGFATALKVNISDKDQVDTAFKSIISSENGVDILVNNAGITKDNLLMRMKESEWDEVLATNLKGVFLCTQAVAKVMIKRKYGRVINISSVVGITGNPGQANYSAAKAGILGFTRSLARELASRNITVNAIAPGFIETDMTAVIDAKVKSQMLEGIPAGRLGSPQEIANMAAFLASDEASYITGQTINVDGGMVMT